MWDQETIDREIKEQKKFYALIKYFKLLIISRTANGNFNLFSLLEGNAKLHSLIKDIEEENISLEEYSLGDLFAKMCWLSSSFNSILVSKTTILTNAQKEADDIKNLTQFLADYEWEPFKDNKTAGETLVATLPIKVAVEPEIREALLSTGKQKTIREGK